MANEILRSRFLSWLAEKYEVLGGSPVETEEFCKFSGISLDDLRPTLDLLHRQKIINLMIGERHALLTDRGYEVAKPSDSCVPKSGGTHINFNAPVTSSAIAFDKANAQVNNYIDNSSNNRNDILEQIQALKLEIEKLNGTERQSAIELVNFVQAQVESPNPSKPVIESLMNGIINGLSHVEKIAEISERIMPLLQLLST
jgi:hypothetical protein